MKKESVSKPEIKLIGLTVRTNNTSGDFEGERAYLADFEVYDQRAIDPANTSVDIYIGIK